MTKKKGPKKKNKKNKAPKNIQSTKKKTKHAPKQHVVLFYLYKGIHPCLQNQQLTHYLDLNTGNSGLQLVNEQVKTEYSSPPVMYPTPKIEYSAPPMRYQVVF